MKALNSYERLSNDTKTGDLEKRVLV